MDGHDYEYMVARYLKGHGYTRTKVTKASGDYGVDVIAHKGGHKYAVQCKYYSNAVGVSAVQEVVAGKAFYGCDSAMVVTNNTFTKAARDLAKANGVTLLEGVRTAGSSGKGWKVAIWVLYILLAIGVINTAIDAAKGQPVLLKACVYVCAAAVVSCPFWIKALWRLVKKKITQRKKPTPQATPAKASTPVQRTEAVQPVRIDKRRIQEAILWCDRNLTGIDIDGIAQAPHIGVSVIQRRCKVGFDRAMKIIDGLQDLGYLRRNGQVYEWTEKALLLDAEGLNGR